MLGAARTGTHLVDNTSHIQSPRPLVPRSVVHVCAVVIGWAISGVVAFAVGLVGIVPALNWSHEMPTWAVVALTYGAVGLFAGGPTAVVTFWTAGHDRATLANVASARPTGTIVPGAASNRELIDSFRSLGRGPSRPRSFLLCADESGLSVWQSSSAAPIFTLPWSEIKSMETATIFQPHADFTAAKFTLATGEILLMAVRRRFGGVWFMNRQQILELFKAFETKQDTNRP